ncbi:MAG: flagellar hook-length control protein FliK [Candidatus Melainabacteria bacterium]|nr:flagellar hook-length control protein FliK [Candidatus Melainabacteria bacterium]
MIPEVTSSEAVSFVDALAARENGTDSNYDVDKNYETVSQEHNASQSKKHNTGNPNAQEAQDKKPEHESKADPVKVKKATKEITDKVKKISKGEASEEVSETDEVEIDEELEAVYLLLLNIIDTRLDQAVEDVTAGIARINLSVEGAVDKIIAQTELIDATRDLALKIQAIAQELLGDRIDIPDLDIDIDLALLEDIHADIDTMIQDYQESFDPELYIEFDASATDETITVGEKLRGLVDIAKTEEVQVVEIKDEQVRVEDKRPVNPLELQVQYGPEKVDTETGLDRAQKVVYELPVAKDTDFKVKEDITIKTDELEIDEGINLGEAVRIEAKNASETKVDINAIKEEIGFERGPIGPERPRLVMQDTNRKFEGVDDAEIIDAEAEMPVEDLMADSSSADSTGGEALLGSQQEVQTTNVVKMPTRTDTVKPIDISAYVQEQVSELPKNSRQEIKLQLNPESLGKIDLTISKNENNEVSIRMMFHDAKTLTHLKTDLKDNLVELKEALKLKNLDLSKFEVGQSKSSSTAYDSQQQQSESYNEARDEQKDRLLNTTPEWLGMAEDISFEEVQENI